MVVPVEDCSDIDKVVECVGNNLKLNFSHNKESLTVIGNKCTIIISENSGFIRVIGNACDVTVSRGTGNIEYVGNSGKISLGPSIPAKSVNYLGNHGVITSADGVFNCDTAFSEKSANITVNRGYSFSKNVNVTISDVNLDLRKEPHPSTIKRH